MVVSLDLQKKAKKKADLSSEKVIYFRSQSASSTGARRAVADNSKELNLDLIHTSSTLKSKAAPSRPTFEYSFAEGLTGPGATQESIHMKSLSFYGAQKTLDSSIQEIKVLNLSTKRKEVYEKTEKKGSKTPNRPIQTLSTFQSVFPTKITRNRQWSERSAQKKCFKSMLF